MEEAINIGDHFTIDKDMNVVIKRIKVTESYREMRVAQELEKDTNLRYFPLSLCRIAVLLSHRTTCVYDLKHCQ